MHLDDVMHFFSYGYHEFLICYLKHVNEKQAGDGNELLLGPNLLLMS